MLKAWIQCHRDMMLEYKDFELFIRTAIGTYNNEEHVEAHFQHARVIMD